MKVLRLNCYIDKQPLKIYLKNLFMRFLKNADSSSNETCKVFIVEFVM